MRQMMCWTVLIGPWLLAPTAPLSTGQKDGLPELKKVAVGEGVELHFVERGKGIAVLFIHGTLGDYCGSISVESSA